jgi:hypothetical protein
LQKDFEKEFPKLCKTKQVVQAWSKILNKKKAIHAYLVEIIISFIPSNLCTYLMQTSSILHFYLLWFVLASITKKGEIEREIGLHLFLYEFWWLNCSTQTNKKSKKGFK